MAEPAEPVAAVSVQTTCDRLFVQGEPRLWSRATTLVVEESNGDEVDEGEVDTVTEQLAKVAAASEDTIRPHVEQMHAAVADLDNLDTGDYKNAATEVANQCAEYVAVN